MATTTTAAATRRRPGMQAPPGTFEVEQREQHHGEAAAAPLLGRQAAGRPGGANGGLAGGAAALLDGYSHPLVVPSDRAFAALLVVPLVVWWVAVLSGVWVYEGLPKGQKVYHLMMWFDQGLLRPAGPLVPFAVLLLRALVHAGSHAARQRRQQKQQQQQQQHKPGPAGPQLGSLLLSCLTVYVAMAVARLAIYLTHYFLLSRRYLEFHIVSDHIFLAATMLICLHTEVVCLLSDMLREEGELQDSTQLQRRGGPGEAVSAAGVLLTLLFVLALFLYLFTAADMYFTAKYYHFPLESLATTGLVFLLFQAPMLVWLVRRRRRTSALVRTA